MIATSLRLSAADHQPVPPPADTAREQRLAWFHEAKFGLFIHWGLYAIPAGEWKGRPVAGIGEWIMNRAQIPVREYEQLAARFNPVKFDADAWVRVAQDAGMQYLVITSKHHDGFALFESKVSSYNVVDATPFHRDVLKELARACERRNLRLGFYYSQAQDWHEPNGAGNTWDFGPDDKKDFDQYLRAKAEPQVRELLSNYGPVCLVWFDTPRMMNVGDRAQRFADLVRTLQPDCLIDGRLGAEGDYQSTGDNAIPDQPMAGAWETPATINHTWGFKQDDDDWKSPGEIIFKLTDIVSKGGNYLLNVGPTAEGVIPERCVEILRAVGRWLKVNGDAIYGTGRTPFGEELGDYAANLRDGAGKPVFLARTDWRCTTKPGKLYFILFRWYRDSFALPHFKNRVTRAYLLADPERQPLELQTAQDGTVLVAIPRTPPNPVANVIAVEIDGNQVSR
ncbi:MAG: alpha-L-fucosidase [Bryobacteraceae bacterium]